MPANRSLNEAQQQKQQRKRTFVSGFKSDLRTSKKTFSSVPLLEHRWKQEPVTTSSAQERKEGKDGAEAVVKGGVKTANGKEFAPLSTEECLELLHKQIKVDHSGLCSLSTDECFCCCYSMAAIQLVWLWDVPKACPMHIGEADQQLRDEVLVPESLGVQPSEEEVYQKLQKKFGDEGLTHHQRIELTRAYRGISEKELLEGASTLSKWNLEIGYKILDTKISSEDEKFNLCMPETFHGTDNFGHPVTFLRLSELKVNKPFSRTLGSIRMVKEAISSHLGYKVRKHIVIADLQGVSMMSFARNKAYAKALFQVPYIFFPDNVYRIYIVNPTKIFNLLWKIVRKWVDPTTLKYITKLNSSEEAIKTLKENGIPQEVIPASLGGKSKGVRTIDLARTIAPK
eukprot:jgi/Bigna1/80915/fgenesh1_pg.75_\